MVAPELGPCVSLALRTFPRWDFRLKFRVLSCNPSNGAAALIVADAVVVGTGSGGGMWLPCG